MRRRLEPLYSIMFKLRKMKLEDQCTYLIACINCEVEGSSRRRELQRLLVERRTNQIRHEMRR